MWKILIKYGNTFLLLTCKDDLFGIDKYLSAIINIQLSSMLLKNIPILRFFDAAPAKEFYIGWLGFNIDWEHSPVNTGVEYDTPDYTGISKDTIEIHRSEYYRNETPGSKAFIACSEIEKHFADLQSGSNKYYRPGFIKTFNGSVCIEVGDLSGNRLSFNEYLSKEN